MENTAVLNVRISEQLKQKLEELAKEKDETVSNYVRELLTKHVLQGGESKKTEATTYKLRYIGKPPLGPEYHGLTLDFLDGEEKEVPEVEAKRLLRTFPSNFKLVAAVQLNQKNEGILKS